MSNLSDSYDPDEAEQRWRDHWQKTDVYGYDDADARLLADDEWGDHLSFHYCSRRAFEGRDGREYACDDVRGASETAPPERARMR